MTENNLQVIEINGIKLEVDLRTARRIDTLRIGSKVKCLSKQSSGGSEVYPGVVIGFEPFKDLPTIRVAYIDNGYFTKTLKVKAVNAETKDFEIIADIDNNALELDRDTVLEKFDRDIFSKKKELEQLEAHRDFFLKNFGVYFGNMYTEVAKDE